MIENSQLMALIAIDQTGSFSKAAEKMQVTQSAISQSIKNLEAKLNFKLIIRDKKEIQLTPEGKKLCELGENFVNDYESLLQSFYNDRHQLVGDYTIGTLDGIGKSFVAKYFINFLNEYQDISLKVLLEQPESLLSKFKKQMIQALILPDHLIPASLEKHELFDEYLCFIVHPDLLGGENLSEIDFSQIKKLPFIFFEEQDPNFSQWARSKYKQVPRGMKPRLVFNSYTPIIHAVREKIGAAVIPSHILERPYFVEQTKNLVISREVFLGKICFAYSSEYSDDLKTQKLLSYLKSSN